MRNRRILALFAHPDDEFAVFPWLRQARAADARVSCAWTTDGGWGGQDIRVRRQESQRVLTALGLDDSELLFLGERWEVADGTLHRQLTEVTEKMAGLPQAMEATELWLPAWEGGHPDHDATHLAGLDLARRTGASTCQFALYHGRGLPGPLFRVLSPLPENGPGRALPVSMGERFRCIARCLHYRSQWKSFAGLLPFYALSMLRRQPFVLQQVDVTRTMQRPHPGPLLYERRNDLSWEEFATCTAAVRALLVTAGSEIIGV